MIETQDSKKMINKDKNSAATIEKRGSTVIESAATSNFVDRKMVILQRALQEKYQLCQREIEIQLQRNCYHQMRS